MEEPQKKLSQRHEGRPRKVRFKISSAYSGRVLKQVFEDGQELEPPAKESSPRRLRHCFEPQDPLCGLGAAAEAGLCSPAKLTAQSISIFKEDKKYNLAGASGMGRADAHDTLPQAPPILEFSKIIIYTNNLKIIRAPMDQKELVRRIIQTEGMNDWAFKSLRGPGELCGPRAAALTPLHALLQRGAAERACPQCRGSGSAPCSLCHGSKFSTLANRFKESYRALRCPACNESGLQPCRICAA
uniref:Glutaredoxin and cysteine rich domain containing 2 n=1 Tax=Nothoprocta perdicaria TaxID=30464 RepID=A0A8C6YUU6_NOTPE